MPIFLLAMAVGVTFAGTLSRDPGELTGLFDAFKYFGPLAYYLDCGLHSDGIPLWNPLSYCGLPFAANPQASLFYPPHLLRGVLNSDPSPHGTLVSMVIAMGLHLLVAGLGVFRLARSHGLSRGASMASAVAFTLSAAMVRRVAEFHYLYTLAWLPWILLAVRRFLSADSRPQETRALLSIGVLAGTAYLGGFLHIIIYMGVAIGVYWAAQRLLVRGARGRGSASGGALLMHDAGRALAAGLIAAGVAAVALLPAAELIGFTARASSESVSLYVDLGSQTLGEWVESFIAYPGLQAAGSGIRGSGLLALVLAIAAVLHGERREVACLGITFLALVDCSIGPPMPLASAMHALTPFANSAHARAYDVALLPLSLLVGFGADALASVAPGRSSWVRRGRWMILLLGGASLFALARWITPHRFLPVGPRVLIAPAAGLVLIAAGALGREGAPWRRWLPVTGAFALLIFLETLSWNGDYTERLICKRHAEPPDPAAGRTTLSTDNVRGVDQYPNRSLFAMASVMNGYEPLNIHRVQRVIDGWERGPEYHRTVTAIEPVSLNQRGNQFLKRPFWLARSWSPGSLPDRRDSYESATTVFLHRDEASSANPPILPSPRSSVVGKPLSSQAVPADLKTIGNFFEAVEGEQQIQRFARLATGHRNPEGRGPGARHTVIFAEYTSDLPEVGVRARFTDVSTGRVAYAVRSDLSPGSGELVIPCPDMAEAKVNFELDTGEGEGRFAFTGIRALADDADEDHLIEILERRPDRVDLEVGPLDDWRLLMHVDAHYPGWWAEVDGERAEIHLANDAFKAIFVPPGTHRVRFQFEPPRVRLGATVSLLTLLLVGVLAHRSIRRHA